MSISPLRAFALGVASVFVLAGVFVAGIQVGDGASEPLPVLGEPTFAGRISCPTPPGFTATRASIERSSNCEDAAHVQSLLLKAGARDANVSVSREPTSELLGPETMIRIHAQVFLPGDLRATWDARQAARAIAASVGTTSDAVFITDDRLRTLYDGADEAANVAAGAGPTARSTQVDGAPPGRLLDPDQ